ncbi:MAG: ABC transporter ATP-binding protein [Candidatus Paceibacteria bacterium]
MSETNSSIPMLEIKNLTKLYGKGAKAKLAVNNISLSIPRGSFFGLLGPNGAGKSSTIHCITGVAQPTLGEILVDGINVVKDYKLARTKVGLSPQEFNVDIFATPVQLMDYMGGYYGIPYDVRQERINELIARFDLEAHRDVKFQKLSGGLKRRAMLGRALIHTPDLLILDEPTAGVDVEQRRDLWNYLKEMNERGKTIILTSHYLEEIQYLCNDIAVINNGEIIWHGSKAEFMAEGKSVEDKYLELLKK